MPNNNENFESFITLNLYKREYTDPRNGKIYNNAQTFDGMRILEKLFYSDFKDYTPKQILWFWQNHSKLAKIFEYKEIDFLMNCQKHQIKMIPHQKARLKVGD